VPDWLAAWLTPAVLWTAAVVVASALISLAVCAAVAVRLPADHFLHERPAPAFAGHPPATRLVLLAGKNVVGWSVVGVGVILSLPGVPGQGVLTILIGLLLVDFPGRRRVEHWILRRPGILTGLNATRRRFGKDPLQVPWQGPDAPA
jgi:hypothetical protein